MIGKPFCEGLKPFEIDGQKDLKNLPLSQNPLKLF